MSVNSAESERPFRFECNCGEWRDDLVLAAEHAVGCPEVETDDRRAAFMSMRMVDASDVPDGIGLAEVR